LEVKFEHFLSFTIKNNKKNLSQQRSKFKNAPFLPFKFKNNLKRVPWHGRCIPVEQSDCTILVTFPGSLVQGNPACDLKIIDSFSFNSGCDLTVRCSKNIISYKHIVKYKFSLFRLTNKVKNININFDITGSLNCIWHLHMSVCRTPRISYCVFLKES
jgi:hypothetical protein